LAESGSSGGPPAGSIAPIVAVRLHRDRVTVALYAHFVAWGWLLYSFSPSVPLIAAEQHISKATAGLHGTSMAAGTVLCAFISAPLVARLGRRGTLLVASASLAAGVGILVSGSTLTTTLPGAFVTAMGGTLLLCAALPALSVHHGAASAAAVVEANGVGSSFGLLAPLALGLSVAAGWGWRPAVAVTIALAAVAAALIGSLPGRGALGSSRVAPGAGEPGGPDGPGAPPTAPVGAPPARGFSGAFWCFWVGLIAAVAIENATTFWAADLLISRTGAGPGIATGALAGLIGGMSAARFIVGPLSLRGQAEKLLIIAFVLAGAGWLVLWLATTTTLAVVGLVVAGLGYGAQYPLSIALVLRASAGRPDQAQARATLGAGGAIAVAPFLLGALADRVGSHSAFLLVPALISIGAVAVALGLRRVRSAAKS
jgi:MFS family permease